MSTTLRALKKYFMARYDEFMTLRTQARECREVKIRFMTLHDGTSFSRKPFGASRKKTPFLFSKTKNHLLRIPPPMSPSNRAKMAIRAIRKVHPMLHALEMQHVPRYLQIRASLSRPCGYLPSKTNIGSPPPCSPVENGPQSIHVVRG